MATADITEVEFDQVISELFGDGIESEWLKS